MDTDQPIPETYARLLCMLVILCSLLLGGCSNGSTYGELPPHFFGRHSDGTPIRGPLVSDYPGNGDVQEEPVHSRQYYEREYRERRNQVEIYEVNNHKGER